MREQGLNPSNSSIPRRKFRHIFQKQLKLKLSSVLDITQHLATAAEMINTSPTSEDCNSQMALFLSLQPLWTLCYIDTTPHQIIHLCSSETDLWECVASRPRSDETHTLGQNLFMQTRVTLYSVYIHTKEYSATQDIYLKRNPAWKSHHWLGKYKCTVNKFVTVLQQLLYLHCKFYCCTCNIMISSAQETEPSGARVIFERKILRFFFLFRSL